MKYPVHCSRVFWLVSLLYLPAGCGQNLRESSVSPGTPTVRVLLLENRQQVVLTAAADPMARVGSRAAVPLNFPRGMEIPVTLTPSGWHIGGATLGTGELVLDPDGDGSLSVSAAPGAKPLAYRGHYRLVPVAGDHFDVVNEVDVEGYLKGVLACELFKTWHLEAYEAQAIVARTYALYEARTSGGGRHFDLYADQRSQVYGGIASESAKSREAADKTRGIVVAYGPAGREKIFKAYFSSCCGGVTQSAADAFGDPATPPLSDQYIGPRCTESNHFNWGPIIIQKTELTRRVRAWGSLHNRAEKEIGDITRVDTQFTSRWGRPTRFVISDARGTRYSLSGEEFRVAFNTSASDHITIWSSFFKPVNETDVIRLVDGHGYGHGVGLCQWCAEHQASQGVPPQTIVLTAFPHSTLVHAY